MIFRELIKTGTRMANDNAPALLTAFGTVGAVTTAVLAGKASFKAADMLRDARLEKAEAIVASGGVVDDSNYADLQVTGFEAVKLVWPLYISAVSSGVLTCGAIIMSHRISSRRAAMLAAAYALNEGKLEEYQEKVKEKFGIKKEQEVRDNIAQDRVDRDYEDSQVIFSPLDGKVLIRDDYSGRFFWSSVEEVNRAVNEINREIHMNVSGYQTVSDFYDLLDLDHVSTSDYFGWNNNEPLEISWSTTTTPNKAHAVHSFEFVHTPIMNPGSNGSFR